MFKYYLFCLSIVLIKNIECIQNINICEKSVTTASGRLAPDKICSGELIFEDNFVNLDFKTWKHENTLSGEGNWEFQWYTNNRSNSFVKDGKLFIKPTLTADYIGEDSLSEMTLDINGGDPASYCTDVRYHGCKRTGTFRNILNPVRSAKLTTVNSFAFKYGKLEISAKLPMGDWLWPALWLLPMYNEYGSWPTSGEINLMQGRGNENLTYNGVNIGIQQTTSTIHWGPAPNLDRNVMTYGTMYADSFNKEFKRYSLDWTPDHIEFYVDDRPVYNTNTYRLNVSFWDYGNFDRLGLSNPWKYGSNLAPFDQEFYIIMSLAVGGTNGYFPDDPYHPSPKPWKDSSSQAFKDFWTAKSSWLPTWKMDENDGETSALQIDYVKVWAM